MGGDLGSAGRLQTVRGLRDLVLRTMGHHEELVRLEGRLIFHNAVGGDAQAIQPGAQGAQPPPTTAPSRAPMIQLTRGPNTRRGPIPGIKKKPDPTSR